MHSRLTQSEIARRLGVSQSLVSLVLNGRRRGIAEKTVERVLALAKDAGYLPKGMAPSLLADSAASFPVVGTILRAPLRLATASNFFSHVLEGLHAEFSQAGTGTEFLGPEVEMTPGSLAQAIGRRPHLLGVVMLGEVATALGEVVEKAGLPLVSVSARARGFGWAVLSDEESSLEMLVEHFHEKGHRRFAWIGGNPGLGRNRERVAALEAALARRGLALADVDRVEMEEGDRLQGFEAAESLLHRHPRGNRPSAWICLNGLMARGAISHLLQEGVKVGREVSLAAVDMTGVCREERPYVTSAAAPPEEMGSRAAHLLLEVRSGQLPPTREWILPPNFFAGETAGPVPLPGKVTRKRPR